MTTQQKLDILKNLQLVINGQTNLWALGMHLFIEYSHKKTDEDYLLLIETIQSQAHDSSERMRRLLGDQYEFFVNYELNEAVLE